MNKTILIVEDDLDIQELLAYNLNKEGYNTVTASDGEEALKKINSSLDCVLLDIMLPKLSGLDVLKVIRYKMELTNLPVIITSAKSEESDVVMGLELGADDYITKPFSTKVLIAKLKAHLRTKKVDADENEIKRGPIYLNLSKHRCKVNDEEIVLTASEFGILYQLIKEEDRVYTRGQLINAVKGDDYPATDRSVDVQVVSLRKKLGTLGKTIKTVWGIGYKFSLEEK